MPKVNSLKDDLYVFDNKKLLFKYLSEQILDISKKSILRKNSFSLVITGGKTILQLYNILSKTKSNFNKWKIFISDERYLPSYHKDRNDNAIYKVWLNEAKIPKENINFIDTDLGLPEARENYEKKLNKVKKFDLVLLSIGEDGHIASLFPNHKYNNIQSVIIERNSPKHPKVRISMSYQRLNNTNNLFKIIIGNKKKSIAEKLLRKEKIPANFIKGQKQKIFINKSLLPKKLFD